MKRFLVVIMAVLIASPVYAWGYTGLEVTQEDNELIEKTNKVLLVVQKQLIEVQASVAEERESEGKLGILRHYVSEDNTLKFIAEVIAYQEEMGMALEDAITRLKDKGIFRYQSKSTRAYLNTEEIECVDFKDAREFFEEWTDRSGIQKRELEIYTRLRKLKEYRVEFTKAAQEEWAKVFKGEMPELEKVELEFPLRFAWWRDCVTSEFGDRDVDEINEDIEGALLSRNHKGLDIGCEEGTELYSVGFGQVVAVEDLDYGLGKSITIFHGNYTTVYGHLSEVKVEVGDYVDSQSLIGLTGSTGWSTGPHLHFELYNKGELLNPLEVFAE